MRTTSPLRSVRAALLSPDDFFVDDANVTLVGAVGIVALVTVLAVIDVFLIYRWMAPLLPAEMRSGVAGILFILVALGNLFVWFVVAAVAHVGTTLADAEGGFSRTLRYVGWGFLPDLVVAPITLAASVYLLVAVPRPESGDIGSFGVAEAAMYADPFVSASTVLALGVVVWNAYLWTFAVAHARRVSPTTGFFAVLIPVTGLFVTILLGVLDAILA